MSRALPAVLGIVVLATLFGHLLDPSVALVSRDIPFLHLPLLTDLAALAREGVPSWNPWIHGGQPVLSNPHYAAFYPPTWLALRLPAHYTLDLLVVLHALWGFLGAWRLARWFGCLPAAAALAAMGFAGGSAVVASTDTFNLFCGLVWLPWAMLWGDRALHAERRADWLLAGSGAALAIAAQALTGSPVTPVLSILALLCLALELLPRRSRRASRLLFIGLLAVALAAVQLLPTLRHLADSPRVSPQTMAHLTSRSTPPWRFLEWLWPRLYGDPMLEASDLYLGFPGLEHELPLILSLHVGYLVLALAIGGLARWRIARRRALGAMLVLGVFLALGHYNPLYSALLVDLPPFSLIRFPEKFVLLSTSALALLAAVGWSRLLEARRREAGLALGVPLSLAAVALAGSLALLSLPFVAPEAAGRLLDRHGVADSGVPGGESAPESSSSEVLAMRAALLGRETFVSAAFWAATLLLLALHRQRRLDGSALVIAVLLFVGLDLLYYGRNFNPTVPAASLMRPPATIEAVPADARRIFSDDVVFHQRVGFVVPDSGDDLPDPLRTSLDRLVPYTGNLWGLAYALNEDTDLMMTRWARHALLTFHLQSGLARDGWTERVHRFLGAWNIATVVRRRSPQALLDERRRTGEAPEPVRLIENPFLLPRYRFVTEVAKTGELEAAVDRLGSLDFGLERAEAVVVPSLGSGLVVETFAGDARLLRVEERSNRVCLEYEADRNAFLIAAITFDRGWRARLDGELVPTHPTALGQIGVELPAGQHRLVLAYRDPAVGLGLGITLAALAGCVILQLPRRMLARD